MRNAVPIGHRFFSPRLRCIGRSKVGPHIGTHVVLRHAAAGLVHQPEAVLRLGVSLLSGQSPPPHCFDVVLRDAKALVKHDPEVVLRLGHAHQPCIVLLQQQQPRPVRNETAG